MRAWKSFILRRENARRSDGLQDVAQGDGANWMKRLDKTGGDYPRRRVSGNARRFGVITRRRLRYSAGGVGVGKNKFPRHFDRSLLCLRGAIGDSG